MRGTPASGDLEDAIGERRRGRKPERLATGARQLREIRMAGEQRERGPRPRVHGGHGLRCKPAVVTRCGEHCELVVQIRFDASSQPTGQDLPGPGQPERERLVFDQLRCVAAMAHHRLKVIVGLAEIVTKCCE